MEGNIERNIATPHYCECSPNIMVLCEASGESELQSMESQVSTVLMKVMFSLLPVWVRPAAHCVSKRDKAALDD